MKQLGNIKSLWGRRQGFKFNNKVKTENEIGALGPTPWHFGIPEAPSYHHFARGQARLSGHRTLPLCVPTGKLRSRSVWGWACPRLPDSLAERASTSDPAAPRGKSVAELEPPLTRRELSPHGPCPLLTPEQREEVGGSWTETGGAPRPIRRARLRFGRPITGREKKKLSTRLGAAALSLRASRDQLKWNDWLEGGT